MIKKWIKPILILTLFLLIMNLLVKDYLPTFHKEKSQPVIVIDPGHGGADPGKVGVNKVLEKDLNLAIAKKLKDTFEKQGFKILMTRETDCGLYSEQASNKKRSDLQARVKLCNESNPIMVISIHQNSYPTADCQGAQVFYHETSEEGEALAGYIQQSIIMNADELNKRKIKANKSYYLLKETKPTTVLVECGFLSNPAEADKLTQEAYQDKLAFSIYSGVMAYIDRDQTKPTEESKQIEPTEAALKDNTSKDNTSKDKEASVDEVSMEEP